PARPAPARSERPDAAPASAAADQPASAASADESEPAAAGPAGDGHVAGGGPAAATADLQSVAADLSGWGLPHPHPPPLSPPLPRARPRRPKGARTAPGLPPQRPPQQLPFRLHRPAEPRQIRTVHHQIAAGPRPGDLLPPAQPVMDSRPDASGTRHPEDRP